VVVGVTVGVIVGVIDGVGVNVGVGEGSGNTGPGPATMFPLVLIIFDAEKNSNFFLLTSKKLGILAIYYYLLIFTCILRNL